MKASTFLDARPKPFDWTECWELEYKQGPLLFLIGLLLDAP